MGKGKVIAQGPYTFFFFLKFALDQCILLGGEMKFDCKSVWLMNTTKKKNMDIFWHFLESHVGIKGDHT